MHTTYVHICVLSLANHNMYICCCAMVIHAPSIYLSIASIYEEKIDQLIFAECENRRWWRGVVDGGWSCSGHGRRMNGFYFFILTKKKITERTVEMRRTIQSILSHTRTPPPPFRPPHFYIISSFSFRDPLTFLQFIFSFPRSRPSYSSCHFIYVSMFPFLYMNTTNHPSIHLILHSTNSQFTIPQVHRHSSPNTRSCVPAYETNILVGWLNGWIDGWADGCCDGSNSWTFMFIFLIFFPFSPILILLLLLQLLLHPYPHHHHHLHQTCTDTHTCYI